MRQNEKTTQVAIGELLKEKLLRWLPEPGKWMTDVPGFGLSRRHRTLKPENCFYTPSVALIVQGSKKALIGSEEYSYGENQCLITAVDMPSSFSIVDASQEHPFLAMVVDLDKYLISQLAAETPPVPSTAANLSGGSARGLTVTDAEPEIMAAFLRLLELLDRPEQISVLAPMIIREIHYRLLVGPQGDRLRALNTLGSQSHQISQAVSWLRNNFRGPLQVDTLARRVNMATSTFHRHFKDVTSLSPLQYHKRLRLYEAQRLMLAEGLDASGAGIAVGYESSTQFNREYKRLFGEPPHRDIKRMQQET